jgi:hypothetical protein
MSKETQKEHRIVAQGCYHAICGVFPLDQIWHQHLDLHKTLK